MVEKDKKSGKIVTRKGKKYYVNKIDGKEKSILVKNLTERFGSIEKADNYLKKYKTFQPIKKETRLTNVTIVQYQTDNVPNFKNSFQAFAKGTVNYYDPSSRRRRSIDIQATSNTYRENTPSAREEAKEEATENFFMRAGQLLNYSYDKTGSKQARGDADIELEYVRIQYFKANTKLGREREMEKASGLF